MSKIKDFYKQAEANPALQADLRSAVIAETVKVAGKHGVTLTAADFDELDEGELDAVAGGNQRIYGTPLLPRMPGPGITISGGSWSDPNPHFELG
jgi:predicted ribosomally synthesized peptide with nif11-like leader